MKIWSQYEFKSYLLQYLFLSNIWCTVDAVNNNRARIAVFCVINLERIVDRIILKTQITYIYDTLHMYKGI